MKYNNDKSRDYTNPSLPSGDGTPGMPMDQLGFGGAGKNENMEQEDEEREGGKV